MGFDVLEKLVEITTATSKPLNDVAAAAASRNEPPSSEVNVTQDPEQLLNHLALDADLEQGLAPMLLQLGYQAQTAEILDPYDGPSRTVTVVKGREIFYIICVPKSILEQAKQLHLGAFSLIGDLFADRSLIYVISRDLVLMDLGFQTMIDNWATRRSIKAKFISWAEVARFLNEKNEAKKVKLIKVMLELDRLPKAEPVLTTEPTDITQAEQDFIQNLLVQKAEGNPFGSAKEYLQNLVNAASLPNSAVFADRWQSDPKQNVIMLLKSVEDPKQFPFDHARKGELKLGWLLKAVFDQILSPDDSEKVLKIILDHHLIRDPGTVADLQAKYELIRRGAESDAGSSSNSPRRYR